jgi:hypothetical protein
MYKRGPEEMEYIKKQHRYIFCLVEVHIGSNVVHEPCFCSKNGTKIKILRRIGYHFAK